ncbi:MAG TPA: hypothetical protein VMW11_06835 [Candidatus Dormibacteraeota bacterium]|nr:hypothetical protein [Candidatus Dormibacteraeota bacterium]
MATHYRLARRLASAASAGAVLLVLAACDPTLGLDLPATRALENGAAEGLTGATSLELTGTYTDSSTRWTIDLQVARPVTEHVVVSDASETVEAAVLGGNAYFRGQSFLARHMGSDPLSANLVKAAGNSWWKGSAGYVPRFADLTDGATFQATFLGSAVTSRTDHVSVAGIEAVDLAGPRADVFIAAAPPYRLLRVHMKNGVTVDQLEDGDLRYTNYDLDFHITAPADVIDFSDLSTLPPVYTVVSVDASGCGSPCTVSALLKNLGGMIGAIAPSTVTFTMTNPVTQQAIGSCSVPVQPDVGYNATTTVTCTMGGLTGQPANAAVVTATADNPGRGS